MFRGDVCLSTMSRLPSRTRLLRPSVRKTTFAGTWSDSPSRFAAYAPVGWSRVPALPANALATLSTLGAVIPTIGCCRGTSYRPRTTRRIVPVAAIRESALSTASREPSSRKSVGENTQPSPRALMRASIARSIGFATFIRNLLSEICMRFSDKREPDFLLDSILRHGCQPLFGAVASVGKLATEAERFRSRGTGTEEVAERRSQAPNGSGVRTHPQRSRDDRERTKARSEGERAPSPEKTSAGHGVETNRLPRFIGAQSRRTLQIGIRNLDSRLNTVGPTEYQPMADSVTQQFLQANNFTNRLCHFSELMIVNRWPRCCGHFDSAASAHLSADRRNYAAANNMASVDKPAVDTQEPSVLSLADCRRLLAGAG